MLIYLHELQNSSSSSTQSDQKENSQLIRYSPPVLESLPSDNAVILPGNQKTFDLIIKSPNKSLITKLSRPNGVESKINDFLDDIFDLSPDPSEQIDPPLVYDDHEAIMQNGLVTGIKVRFRPRYDRVTASSATLAVCSRIHSPEVRENKKCNDLSHLDIFGLEPLPFTEFSAMWDAAFLNQLLQDGKQFMSFISRTIAQATQREAANCTWLRVGIYFFLELLKTNSQSSPKRSALFAKIAHHLKDSDLEVLLKSLFEQAESLLKGIQIYWYEKNAQSKWEAAVRDVNNAYEEVLTRITDFLNFMDSPLAEQGGIRNSVQAIECSVKMYHSFRNATEASIRAAMSNEKVWDMFYAQIFGLGLSGAFSAYTLFNAGLKIAKSGFLNLNGLQALGSIGGLGWSLKKGWDQWTYCGYCKALETFLGSGRSIVFYCDILIKIIFLQQHRRDQQVQQLDEHEWFRQFKDNLYWDTGMTPTTMTLQGYKNYLQNQRALLKSIMDSEEVKKTVQSVCGKQGDQEALQPNEDDLQLVVTIAR